MTKNSLRILEKEIEKELRDLERLDKEMNEFLKFINSLQSSL